MISLIQKFSKKPELRKKQYKRLRDVLVCQGYVAGVSVIVGCIGYNAGSRELKKLAAKTTLVMIPFGTLVAVGKSITVAHRVGTLYRIGRTAYNIGMRPVKIVNFLCQSPYVILDMVMIGEVYIPAANAKWWHIGNATDDAESSSK